MKKQLANIITGLRIVCSVAMLFFAAETAPFWILYLLCGITDMVDGTVARKTHSVSAFGAKLDTLADLAFVAVALIKWLPLLEIPVWLWCWIAGIVLLKAVNVLLGFVVRKQFVSLHTVFNKVTGLCLFLLPLTLVVVPIGTGGAVVCTLATCAALEEGWRIVGDRCGTERK